MVNITHTILSVLYFRIHNFNMYTTRQPSSFKDIYIQICIYTTHKKHIYICTELEIYRKIEKKLKGCFHFFVSFYTLHWHAFSEPIPRVNKPSLLSEKSFGGIFLFCISSLSITLCR